MILRIPHRPHGRKTAARSSPVRSPARFKGAAGPRKACSFSPGTARRALNSVNGRASIAASGLAHALVYILNHSHFRSQWVYLAASKKRFLTPLKKVDFSICRFPATVLGDPLCATMSGRMARVIVRRNKKQAVCFEIRSAFRPPLGRGFVLAHGHRLKMKTG